MLKDATYINVHIDNLAAQTGVTRFTQLNQNWVYNKSEFLQPEDLHIFTHLIIEGKSKYSSNLKPFIQTHAVLDSIEGFSHINFNYQSLLPFKVRTKPYLYLLERKSWRNEPYNMNLFVPDYSNILEDYTERELSDSSLEEITDDLEKQFEEPTPVSAPIVLEPTIHVRNNIKSIIHKYKEVDEIMPVVEGKDEKLHDLLTKDTNETQNVHSNEQSRKQLRKKLVAEKIKDTKLKASAKQKLKELIIRHKQQNIHQHILSGMKEKLPVKKAREDTVRGTPREVLSDDTDSIAAEKETQTSGQEPESLGESVKEYDIKNYLQNTSIQEIVDEVLKKLLEKKQESEDVLDIKNLETAEQRAAIQQIVEEIINEKFHTFTSVNYQKDSQEVGEVASEANEVNEEVAPEVQTVEEPYENEQFDLNFLKE